jgi:hypothetical protein
VKQCARLMRSQINGREWIEGRGVREKDIKRERTGEFLSNLDFESSRDFCVFVWTV